MRCRTTQILAACCVAVIVWLPLVAPAPAAPASRKPAPASKDAVTADDADLTPDGAYRACFHWLAAGKQREIERVLAEAVRTFPNDARLLFFAAACERSRFDLDAARPLFERVVKADAEDGLYGRAARMILDMDARRDIGKNFDALRALADKHMDDPMVVWMAGVQCRTVGQPDKGLVYYERLLKLLGDGPGPVLVHQTYANLLDDCGRPEDAMPHRRMAVKLEPAGWSYDGMANTLTRLGRFDEADAAYAKAIELSEPQEQHWVNWTWSYRRREDHAGTAEKCRQGTELHPRSVALWNNWGNAERALGRRREALARYETALKISPRSARALRGAAVVLRELGEAERAQEMDDRLAALAAEAAAPAAGE